MAPKRMCKLNRGIIDSNKPKRSNHQKLISDNKKNNEALTKYEGPKFVLMLVSCMPFLEFESATSSNKGHAKTKHHNKLLALLILSQL